MRLGVNGWRLHGQRTGVGRYLLNIVTRWSPEVVAERFDAISLYTPTPLSDVPLPGGVSERVMPPAWRMLVWENLRLGPAAGDDVLFCPSYSRPMLTRGKVVVTTHDATAHLHPELYPRSMRLFYDRLYGWSARHADLVITTTAAVRDDVARCYGVPRSRLRVVPLAADPQFRPRADDERVADVHRRYAASAPFFLFVGKLSGRRNVPGLIRAFGEFKRNERAPHKLVVIGRNTEAVNVPQIAAECGVADDVRQRDYIPDGDLCLLYNAAEALVIPSTFETLSLPVMEAQASGTPVITIDTPGLRETTGSEALLLPTADVHEIVGALTRMAGDATLRRDLAERGLRHAATLSWDRTARETLAVLAEAAGAGAAGQRSARAGGTGS